jgi:hypothetical protein
MTKRTQPADDFDSPWMMVLPDEAQDQFRADLWNLEQEKAMPYLSSIERLARDEGIEEGQQEGLRKGLLEGIALALDMKFGRSGRKLLAQARALRDVADLRRLVRFIRPAKTVADVAKHLRRPNSRSAQTEDVRD